ncbi:MAG: hypothetical protein ABIO76_04385 [Ginsengibacter sp.]
MTLLPNEEKLVISNGDKIILTTHRIRLKDRDWYGSYSMDIFLEDISSIETKYKGNVIFLILGCLALSSTLYFSMREYTSGSLSFNFIAGIVLLVLWWFSRKHLVSITSHGCTSLVFETGKIPREQVENFIYKIQLAKAKRIITANAERPG